MPVQGNAGAPLPTPKRVVVIGAGVAGLTAAQELVERGYEVEVVEAAASPYDETAARVGGLARTSWAAVPFPGTQAPMRALGVTAAPLLQGLPADDTPAPEVVPLTGDEVSPEAKSAIATMAPYCVENGAALSILCLSEPTKKLQDALRAEFERNNLRGSWDLSWLDKPDEKSVNLLRNGLALGLSRVLTDAGREWAQLAVERTRVPGEHGFRFFPSFYRHMFDTMKRIPIGAPTSSAPSLRQLLDSIGVVLQSDSSRSVFDALESADVIQVGLKSKKGKPGSRSFSILRAPMRSVQELRELLGDVLERAGYRGKDLYRLVTRYAEYLTSAPERRRADYETTSWSDFLGLDDDYSPYFVRHVNSGSQALVAMSSTTNDARTVGSVAMQLTLDELRVNESGYSDATLRGPTSVELFDPWQAYLESQNVQFTRAALVGFVRVGMAVRPVFGTPSENGPVYKPIDPADYYVVTIPVDKFRAIFRDKNPQAPATIQAPGVQLPLCTSDHLLKANDQALTLDRLTNKMQPCVAPGEDDDDIAKYLSFGINDYEVHPDEGPFRYMCGVQFFFAADIKAFVGHALCLDSAWGVSYISQAQYWQDRPRGQTGIRGVISAIFTRFEEKAQVPSGQMKTILECTKDEVAATVWGEIKASWNAQTAGQLPDPLYYYIDENLQYENSKWTNKTPYLVNSVETWPRRGGVRTTDDDYVYRVQLGHTVFAGAFMRTHTRLNTMEAANETGRRAANAILDYDGSQAQRCATWNMEDYEIPEFLPLRELDKRIFRRGGRHSLRSPLVEGILRATPWDAVRMGLPVREEGK
jgi:uncharacterized protein with NAD-binding domain and iron-sulfur cluster